MTTLDMCACKRGFFTLRDCGNPATTSCQLCTRRVCEEHLAPRVDTRVCLECAAKQEEGQQPQPAQAAATGRSAVDDEEEMVGREYPYRYRRQYYSSYSYFPWWWGTYDPYYDDYGYRYFDDDDDDGGGFGDS